VDRRRKFKALVPRVLKRSFCIHKQFLKVSMKGNRAAQNAEKKQVAALLEKAKGME
jgi:hypothetical protein